MTASGSMKTPSFETLGDRSRLSGILKRSSKLWNTLAKGCTVTRGRRRKNRNQFAHSLEKPREKFDGTWSMEFLRAQPESSCGISATQSAASLHGSKVSYYGQGMNGRFLSARDSG